MVAIERKTSLTAKIGFGIGSIPDSTYFFAWDLFVLFYYTQVLGLSGSLVGTAVLIVMVVDAISDAYVGHFSDNLKGLRYGRRHTLMAASILPLVLSFIALFSPPAGLSTPQLFSWLLVFALLTRIAITFYIIPFRAVGAELSRNPAERSSIFALAAIGNGIARICLPLIAFGVFFKPSATFEKGQLDPANYPAFALAFALAMGVTMVMQVLATYRPCIEMERTEAKVVTMGLSPLQGLKAVWRALTLTPNVGRLLALSIFVFISIVSISVLKIHIVTYLWQVPARNIGMLISAQAAGSLLGAAALPLLFGRRERRQVIRWGFVTFASINALALIAPLTGLAPPAGSVELAYLLIGLFFLAGIALGCYFVSISALGGDIADEHEVNTSQRQQGLIGGFSTFAIKISSGLMTLVTGFFLDLIKFPVGAPVAEVPAAKAEQLALFILAFCIISAALVTYMISRIDVSKQKQARINEGLARLNEPAPEQA
jgi:Na+/melibiose symporter-like transporter